MTEKEKFFKNLEEKHKKGLKSINLCFEDLEDATEEEFYAELNRMEEAPDIKDDKIQCLEIDTSIPGVIYIHGNES